MKRPLFHVERNNCVIRCCTGADTARDEVDGSTHHPIKLLALKRRISRLCRKGVEMEEEEEQKHRKVQERDAVESQPESTLC